MSTPVDIKPGIGKPGIREARDELVAALRGAVLAVYAAARPDEEVRVCRWQDVPYLTIAFDTHTMLLIEPWSMGPAAGFLPRWRFSVSDVGDLLSPSGPHPLPSYDRAITAILSAVRVVLGMKVELAT